MIFPYFLSNIQGVKPVFNGAFSVALNENFDIKSALRFASAAAALSVTKKEAQTSIPTRKEVEEFLIRQRIH
jgi:ribokinase